MCYVVSTAARIPADLTKEKAPMSEFFDVYIPGDPRDRSKDLLLPIQDGRQRELICEALFYCTIIRYNGDREKC